MKPASKFELRRLIIVTLALFIVGLISHYFAISFALGLALYLAWSLINTNRIYQWLLKKNSDESPALPGIWGDITKQIQRLKKRLNHSQTARQEMLNRVEDITSSLPNGIVLLNQQLLLEWWNPSAARFLSLRTADKGQHIIDLVPSMALGEFVMQGDFSDSIEFVHPDNQYLVLNLNAAPFGDGETILVIQDVSRLRQLEQTRKDFVDNISHELRTPLTVIGGYIENLQFSGDNLSPSFQKALLQMAQQTKRMSDLTNDLLLLSRLESLTENAEFIPVALAPLLTEIITAANDLSAGKQIITIDCDKAIFLLGDRSQLSSALSNLVFNAVRHTLSGCIINISVAKTQAGVSISVKDDGDGIEQKHLSRLTERFYRVSGSRNSDTGGTGLGLAIVKHILMRHDGKLTIKSVFGEGAEFSCHLPNTRLLIQD